MKTSENRRSLSLVVLLVCISLVLSACNPPTQRPQLDIRTPVYVETVKLGDVEKLVKATGLLRPSEISTESTQIRGRVWIERDENGRRLEEGDEVQQGDILARIIGIEAELAIGLDNAELARTNAEAALKRSQSLFDIAAIPESQLEQAVQAFENADRSFEEAKVRATNVEVKASISGTILTLNRDQNGIFVAEGQLQGAGHQIARIAPLDRLEAVIDMMGPVLEQVELGMPVRVNTTTLDNVSFPGVLAEFKSEISSNRTTQAVIEVDNTQRKLSPGGFVEVEIIIEQRLQVPTVSHETLTNRNMERVVFLVEGPRVKRQRVETGLQDEDSVEILGGVEVGDRIVHGALDSLYNDSNINVLGEL